jgi:hypothetical protein
MQHDRTAGKARLMGFTALLNTGHQLLVDRSSNIFIHAIKSNLHNLRTELSHLTMPMHTSSTTSLLLLYQHPM